MIKRHSLIAASLLPLLLGGCSTIKSWFPDKERDYQFTAEIPELIIPQDLQASGVSMPPADAVIEAAEVAGDNAETSMIADKAPAPVSSGKDESPVAQAEPMADSKADTEAAAEVYGEPTSIGSSLQIDQSKTQAGHIVSKALSRQKLEIVERNIPKGYFRVRFDPDAAKVEDKTWSDELNFLFGDEPSQEIEYRVHLQPLNPQLTEVTVRDKDDKPLASKAANALLKLITDAINQDVAPANEDKQSADSHGDNPPQAQP